MMQPNKINSELARILSQRIKKLVKKARYYPSKIYIHRDTAKVVAPYLESECAASPRKIEDTK